MNLSALRGLLNRLPAYTKLLSDSEPAPQAIFQAARPFVAAALKQQRSGPLVYITARSETAQQVATELETWLVPPESGGPRIHIFAEPDALPYERISWSSATRQQRLTALSALQSRSAGPSPVIVASARALMQYTLPAKELRMALRPVRVGAAVRLDLMTQNWVQTGYNPAEVVEEPGTFARRGGIVDIWPPNLTQPVRIDLFGDEVESLRVFDPATQRTRYLADSVEIGPGSEALSKYGPSALTRLGIQGDRLNAAGNLDAGAEGSPLQDPRLLLAIREELRLEVEHLAQGQSFHGIEWYLPYVYERPASLLDYLNEATTLILDDAVDFFVTLRELEAQAGSLHEELQHSGELPHNFAAQLFYRRRTPPKVA